VFHRAACRPDIRSQRHSLAEVRGLKHKKVAAECWKNYSTISFKVRLENGHLVAEPGFSEAQKTLMLTTPRITTSPR